MPAALKGLHKGITLSTLQGSIKGVGSSVRALSWADSWWPAGQLYKNTIIDNKLSMQGL